MEKRYVQIKKPFPIRVVCIARAGFRGIKCFFTNFNNNTIDEHGRVRVADPLPRRRTASQLRPGRTSRGVRHGCARQRFRAGHTVPGKSGGQRRSSVRSRRHVAEFVGHRLTANEPAGGRQMFGWCR